MEVELAQKAGLGWRGKHTLLLNRERRLVFLPRARSTPICRCRSMRRRRSTAELARNASSACPTGAIVAPYELDARRCISYLTIEHKGAIPEELRPLIGNRVYGCDDCQLACPWNRFAQPSGEADFSVRNGLDSAALVELFAWTRSGVPRTPCGQRDPPHRLRALAAQSRGRHGQRATQSRRRRTSASDPGSAGKPP